MESSVLKLEEEFTSSSKSASIAAARSNRTGNSAPLRDTVGHALPRLRPPVATAGAHACPRCGVALPQVQP